MRSPTPISSTDALRAVLAVAVLALGWGVAGLLIAGRIDLRPWWDRLLEFSLTVGSGLVVGLVTVALTARILPRRFRR